MALRRGHQDAQAGIALGPIEHHRTKRSPGLQRLPDVTAAVPAGGMYAFFRVHGQDDSLAFAKRLVADHGLGLAPGVAFGPEGEGWLRWCFASRDPARLDQGLARLGAALGL
jgi:aspartate/methionine/tyrosine aminotransferase